VSTGSGAGRRLPRRWTVAGLAIVAVAGASLAGCGRGPDASPQAFCSSVATVPVITSTEQLQGPQGQADLDRLRASLGRLRDRSPADVRDDVETLATVTTKLRDALRKEAVDPAAGSKEAAQLEAPLAAFQSASERIVRYTEQTCGIELGQQ
jgi:hypothetical protein